MRDSRTVRSVALSAKTLRDASSRLLLKTLRKYREHQAQRNLGLPRVCGFSATKARTRFNPAVDPRR